MEITSVEVKKTEIRENSKMRAWVSVVLDNCFKIRNIRILEGDRGLWLAMPSFERAPGEHKDVAHPLNQETRDMFETAIFAEYNKTE